MKIQLISDLHMEFSPAPDIRNAGADVLIMAGDICVAEHLYRNPTAGLNDMIQKGYYADEAIKYRKFFKQVSQEFETVLYVMGNHEHYNGRWSRTADVLNEECARHGNIFLMEKHKHVINDVVFLGATLWSDLNGYDPLTELTVRDMMNDYKVITQDLNGQYHKLTPATTAATHRATVEWLKMQLELDKRKTVVIGHHAPSRQSIHPRFANQVHMNGAFASSLDDMMLDTDHVAVWVHGHVHDTHDYVIGNTRVLCNPHGYPRERPEGAFNTALVIEV